MRVSSSIDLFSILKQKLTFNQIDLLKLRELIAKLFERAMNDNSAREIAI
jgi:hypothetical protein